MVCFVWNTQDSFIANLLRLIHTMRPPKKKRKDRKKAQATASDVTEPSDPALLERKKRFPGLSQPDNPSLAQTLLEPGEQEGMGEEGEEEEERSNDHKVASEALSEVR